MTPTPTVQGRCPACSRSTLILGAGGYVTCSHLDCPSPASASDLLEQAGGCPDPIECDHEAALGQARELLRQFTNIADVTHKYRIMGGCDSLGANHSCAGCELNARVRAYLEATR
jgi:hypothetical protein